MIREESPFTPGSPVPAELFVGRSDQIEELRRYVAQAVSGRQENIFLTGDRGIGKSSFASFLRHSVSKKLNVLGIHVFLGGATSLDDVVRHVLEQILKETSEQSWFEKIQGLFGQYIQQVGAFGISVKFAPPASDLSHLVTRFPEAIGNIVDRLSEERDGLLIILDDINGLADKPEFANWYKSFVDEIATHHPHYPVAIILIGLPEKRDSLAAAQPSLMRVFRIVQVDRLTDEEVGAFLVQAFHNAGIEVEPSALDVMVDLASGLPILMHEIGDAVFRLDDDGIIARDDIAGGIVLAAQNVGIKYLDPGVYRELRSRRYLSILGKIVESPADVEFKRSEVMTRLDGDEKKVFDNLLRRLRSLGIVETDRRGTYRFVNRMYPIYMYMVSSSQATGRNLGS